MCVVYLYCWKSIGYMELTPYLTPLNAFKGISFRLQILISSFPVQLGGKSIPMKVEVLNAQVDYILLGRICTYAMMVSLPLVFLFLFFHHKGRIVMIDHMFSNRFDYAKNLRSIVPLIEKSHMETESIGVGM